MKKIAWGITGGGHMLEESVKTIQNLLSNYEIDIFISRSAEEVLKQYKLDGVLDDIKDKNQPRIKIIKESMQSWAFPASAKLGIGKYHALVISPMTGNTVAKSIHCIADTLITNCFAQALKINLKIICIPTDFKQGKIRTKVPNGEMYDFTIDKYNAKNTKELTTMDNVFVCETPDLDRINRIIME